VTPMNDARNLPVVTYLSMDPVTSTVGQSQVLNYIERLAEGGLAIELVTFEHHVDTALRARLVDLGVSWWPQNYGRHGAVAGLGRVIRAAGVIRGAALVHARSDMAAAAAILAGIDNWVWDVRSLWADQKVATGVLRSGSPQERILRWVERRSATGSAAVITLTASAIAELDRRYDGIVAPKARVITTCTDLERFSVSPMPTTTTVRVLLAGTLNRYYDMRSMLDLVAELRRRRPVEFVVVSPESTAFEDELAALEVIRLSATPDEMVELVASCHVGLSVCRDDAGVSLKAAMPTKIGEFLASGRPVVVNPGLVDIAELVQSCECGIVFGSSGPCSVEEAVDLIEERLADPATPGRCRGLAEEHFDLERGVDHLLDTYRSVHARP
jgi:glycosyltransferase involved in cell wall biosynthesis